MKKILPLLTLLLSTIHYSQTTYNSTDFATQNEQFIVSHKNTGLSGFDFTVTGANHTWDYSQLSADSQETVLWENPNNTGYKVSWCLANGYTLDCNTQFNNAFNLANKLSDGIQLQGIGLTNIVDHLKLDTSKLENKMIGAGVSVSGVTIPFVAQYQTPDEIYHFPINYNDNYTTNNSLSIDLNSIGIPVQYASTGQRTNLVEGWGSLQTPFGNFPNVLKMKTTLVTNYSITTASGTVPTSVTSISYKWFDPNYGIPVLEVDGDLVSGNWIPTKATYIDNQQCLQPTALFGYLPLVPDYDPNTQSVTVSFINTSSNYDSSSWDFGDGSTSTDANPTHTYLCPGTKQVKLTVTNLFCNPNLMDNITLPIVITDTQNSYTNTVTVTDTSLSADRVLTGTTYQWVDCDNGNQPIAGETNQTFMPSSNGNYAVILTTNGCQSTSACYSFNILGTTDFLTNNRVVLYPNPTTGKIFTTIVPSKIIKISIYDVLGQLVSEKMSLEGLKSGVYVVSIKTIDGDFTEKIIKK